VAYVRGSVLQAYSSALEGEGEYALALEMAQQAVLAREPLPLRYSSEKCESDVRLAECLARYQRWEEAHEVATQGIDLLRPLAESRPGANGPSLARWLLALCRIDAYLPHCSESCEPTAREALGLLEPQADEFGPELAEAYHELALALNAGGKASEAAEYAEKALNIRIKWAKMGGIQGFDQLVVQSRELYARLARTSNITALNVIAQGEDDEMNDEVTW
jgi:tetratricopeptide (TPR) repeat protein